MYIPFSNKKTLTLLILILFSIGCKERLSSINTVTTKSDSLIFYFDSANNDSTPFLIRKSHVAKALKILSVKKNDSIARINYFKAANRYYNMNAIEEYKKTTNIIISKALQSSDSLSLGKAYSYLGDYYTNKYISDSAYIFYNKSGNIYKRLHENQKFAKNLLNKSVLQFNEKDYIGSEKSAIEALTILRTVDNDGLRYDANNLLGIIYNELNEFSKSIEFHNKALIIVKKGNLENLNTLRASSLNNIGLIYQNKGEHFVAIKYFKLALQQPDLFNTNIEGYVSILNNMGLSELELHDYKNLPKLFLESAKISDSLNFQTTKISSKLNLSRYYSIIKDSIQALKLANEAYTLAKSHKLSKELLLSLKQLADINPKKSGIYSKQYIVLNDSLQLTERKIRNKLARIEYETEELTLEKDKLVEQRKTLIYIGLAIILVAVLVFVIRFQAAKNRELLFVQEQQKANEEIYQLMLNQQNKIEEVRQLEKKRIAQELHDGILGKLFGTRMNLGVLNNRNDENANNDRVIFIDELQTLEQEIREISHDLSSEKTAVFNNFVIMVTSFIETQKTICKAAITFSVDPLIEWNSVDNLAKINLYRILQEAFQNINKYANAKNVSVQFKKADEEIQLSIHDDGAGFVYTKKKKGIGLINMNSRITSLRGSMEIETQPGNGTQLKFRLPLV